MNDSAQKPYRLRYFTISFDIFYHMFFSNLSRVIRALPYGVIVAEHFAIVAKAGFLLSVSNKKVNILKNEAYFAQALY